MLSYSTCDQCGGPVCETIGGDSSGSSNNAGAVAGGIVAALVAILLAVGFLWYRRRRSMAAAAAFKRATVEVKPDVVASADTVLNRPDPLEKPASLASLARTSELEDAYAIRLGNMMHPPENPFADHDSIATASDRATNVIPIGLITPRSTSIALSHATQNSGALTPASVTTTFSVPPIPEPRGPNTPMRPQRAGPEIDMRLDLTRPASEAPSLILLPPKVPYAHSSRSGLSSRASTLSTSSSFLNEAPQIVTPKQANFRQVLGVQRAEVVKFGSTPPSPSSVKSYASVSTAGKSSRSPLGQAAYDANNAHGTLNQPSHNPFADQDGLSPLSPSPVDWNSTSSRPTSTMSTAESVANISSAQRVQLVKPTTPRIAEAGALLAPSPLSTPRSADFRTAGQLSPPAQAIPRSFDDMTDHRDSQSSFALTNRTSTTDSILEAFPFVPPSPMSLHNTSQSTTPIQRTFQQQQQAALQYSTHSEQPQLPKPSRSTMGFSTISSASSGLGGFPFQFEGDVQPPLPPGLGGVDVSGRASLDTIQLSRDLAEFPLPGDSPVTPKAK